MRIDFDKFVAINKDDPKYYKMVESTVRLFREYQNGDELKFPVNEKDVAEIFSKKNISKTSYYVSRSILLALFVFIQEENNINTRAAYDLLDGLGFNSFSQPCNSQWFFEDLSDIYKFFDNIAKEKGLHIDDFANYKCLCGLYYYGLNNEQICNIKKSDINTDKNSVKLFDGTIEILDEYTISLLLTVFNMRYYRNLSTGKLYGLGSSDYLVLLKTKDKNDSKDLAHFVTSINYVAAKRGVNFKSNNLRKIYWFNQIQTCTYTLQEVKEIISSDYGIKIKFENEYYQWVQWLNKKKN